MTFGRSLRRRPLRRRWALAAAFAIACFAAMPGAASAHSELVSSDPEAGGTVEQTPDLVSLTFNEPVQKQGSSIVVTAGSDVISTAGTFTIDGTTASVELDDADASGTVEVAFRIVSEDGHVVRDTFSFEVAGGATATQTPEPTSTTQPSPASNEESDESTGSIVWVLGLGAIGLVLVAALIAVGLRGRRGPSS